MSEVGQSCPIPSNPMDCSHQALRPWDFPWWEWRVLSPRTSFHSKSYRILSNEMELHSDSHSWDGYPDKLTLRWRLVGRRFIRVLPAPRPTERKEGSRPGREGWAELVVTTEALLALQGTLDWQARRAGRVGTQGQALLSHRPAPWDGGCPKRPAQPSEGLNRVAVC